MRKQFKDASVEELKEIFKANNKLQEQVEEDFIETEMYWIGEALDCFRDSLSNWSIGTYQRNYIEVKDSEKIEFLEGCISATEMFGTLDEENANLAKVTINKINELENFVYDFESEDENYGEYVEDTEKYQELDEEIESNIEKIIDEIVGLFTEALDVKQEPLIDYFVEFYSEERMGLDVDDFTFDEETYELFEHVEYTKSYV